jgi:hypothetical protein
MREANPNKAPFLKPLKRGNKYLCLSTDKIRFLDVSAYLSPGTSYAKFLKGYGIEQQKGKYSTFRRIFPYRKIHTIKEIFNLGFFPYDWFQSIDQLSITELPSQASSTVVLKKAQSQTKIMRFFKKPGLTKALKL